MTCQSIGTPSVTDCHRSRPTNSVFGMTNTTTDQGCEDLIAYCGQRLIKAQEAGDKGLAYFWLEAQNTQIRLRSPEQVARMEAEKGIA